MPIEIPDEIAYFYESSIKRNRLLYWIPEKKLRNMVAHNQVNERIIEDYPFGVEISVSNDDFDFFREKYNLIIDVNPEDVWNAFLSLWLKNKKGFLGIGYLNKEELETIAKKIKDDINQFEDKRLKRRPGKKPSSLRWSTFKKEIAKDLSQKEIYTSKLAYNRKKQRYLKNYKIPKFDKRKSINKQFISKVHMSRGESPERIFKRLNKNRGGT